MPISKQASDSAPIKSSFDSRDHGCNQTRMPLTTRPGATSNAESRATRRSNGARCDFRKLILDELFARGLEPILFHPPVKRAAAQAERLGCLTHIALIALKGLANQNTFNPFKTQFL